MIGAGVIGLAISYNLSMRGKKVILVEKEKQFGTGISSRSSEVIHAGIYYNKGSLKSRLCIRGKELLYEFCNKYSVRHDRIGKLFIAVSDDEISRLEIINKNAIENGLINLIELDSKQLKKIEPFIRGKSALLSPSTGIIDSHGLMQALMNLNDSYGTMYAVLSTVLGAERNNFGWSVKIGGVEPITITSRAIVNAAGLYSLELSKKIFPERSIPKANPVKGGYVRYSGKSPIKHIVYPAIIPGKIEERVDATPDLSGSLRFGPSVEKTNGFEDFSFSSEIINRFIPAIKRYLPDLDVSKLHLDQAGIRPKIIVDSERNPDFIIDWADDSGWLDLWGIESPGLTASLAIGEHVSNMFNESGLFN